VAPTLPLGADLSLPGIARLVAEFLDRLNMHEVTLVGNDTGGALAQLLMAEDAGGNPALAQFELEIMPGAAVEDDQLADVIASNLASHGHPTATAPMGGPQDPWAVVDSHGAPKGIDALRAADASIMPVAPSVATNPTTIMIAERIAEAVYATDGTLGGVPVLEIAAPGGRGC
jgi:choline dehydrogenase-like flavoprotein